MDGVNAGFSSHGPNSSTAVAAAGLGCHDISRSSASGSVYGAGNGQETDDSFEVNSLGGAELNCPSAQTEGGGNQLVTKLPVRLFATDRFPNNGRVNSYSKMQYLIDIVDILHGTPEFKVVLNSQFGKLFRLPTARCSLSGKLVHNLLCRQIISRNKHDAWFTFGGKPIRFSIAEFEHVTGLRCGPFAGKRNQSDCSKARRSGKSYWKTLFGTEDILTLGDIVETLRSDPNIPGWRKLRLALIVLVEGVLICGTQPESPTKRVVEMVRDLDGFLDYPWGRESFLLTLRMVKVGSQVKTTDALITKLKKSSIAQHGFPLAIQLWLFEVIPSLTTYLPRPDCVDTFVDHNMLELPRLRTYHSDDIFKLELDPKLSVISRLALSSRPYDGDDALDPCIAYLEQLLDSGARFTKSNWVGGDTSLSPLCFCSTNRGGRCSCGTDLGNHNREPQEHVPSSDQPATPCPGCADPKQAVLRLEEAQVRMEENLPKTLKSKVERMRVMEVKNRRSASSEQLQSANRDSAFCVDAGIGHKRKYSSLFQSPGRGDAPPLDVQSRDAASCEPFELLVEISKPPNPGVSRVDIVDEKNAHTEVKVLVQDTGKGDRDSSVSSDENDLPTVPSTHLDTFKREKANTRTVSRSSTGKDISLSDGTGIGNHRPRRYLTRGFARKDINLKGSYGKYQSHRHDVDGDGMEAEHSNAVTGVVYNAFPLPPTDLVKRLKGLLKNYSKRDYDLDYLVVPRNFFTQILTPREWLTNCHLDMIIRSVWKRCGPELLSKEMTITDCFFTQSLVSNYKSFCQTTPTRFKWPSMLRSYVCGHDPDREDICPWGRSIQTVYAPMNWGCRHWVGLVINLRTWEILILDPLLTATPKWRVRTYIEPVISMLPHLLAAYCSQDLVSGIRASPFAYSRPTNLSSNDRTGDCGPLVVKFIELHSHELPLNCITDAMVDQLRISYALNVYSDFVKELV